MPLRPILKPLPPFSESLRDHSADNHEHPILYSPNNPLPFASLSRIPPLESPHVHFPPTPILTRIEMTYSRSSYDRKPILVSPNMCALPDRGERDVDYFDAKNQSPILEGSYFPRRISDSQLETCLEKHLAPTSTNARSGSGLPSHSRAKRSSRIRGQFPHHSFTTTDGTILQCARNYVEVNLCSNQLQFPPPLIFDPSSESESDMCVSPPVDPSLMVPGISHISTHFRGGGSQLSHFSLSSFPYDGQNQDGLKNSEYMSKRIGKRSREGKHGHEYKKENGRQNGSEGCSEEDLDEALGLDPITGGIIKRARSRTRNVATVSRAGTEGCGPALSNFHELGLDGCLGGF